MTLISAHRGGFDFDGCNDGSARGDELFRYQSAIGAGIDMVEIDVRCTRDGVLVCRHDESLDGLGSIAELDYRSLATSSGGESVIRADKLMKMAAGRTTCHLDVKTGGYELALVDLALSILGPQGFVVTSTDPRTVALVRAERPAVSSILTIGRSMKNAGLAAVFANRVQELLPFRVIRDCGANGIAVHWGLVTAPLLAFARRHDLFVMVWTVNRPRSLRRYFRCDDIDVVVTDRPLAAREIRAASGKRGKVVVPCGDAITATAPYAYFPSPPLVAAPGVPARSLIGEVRAHVAVRQKRNTVRLPVRHPFPAGPAGDQLSPSP